MVKITYNKKARILSLRLSPKTSVDSDVQENVVIDRDKVGNIVNVDIMDVDLREFKQAQTQVANSENKRFEILVK